MNQQTELVTDNLEQARHYVWNDPTFDRAAFENRLQNEPHLAELVAEVVSEYLEIQAALISSSHIEKSVLAAPANAKHRLSGYFVNAAWALSIAVAVAVLVIPMQWNSESQSNLPLTSLAQIWSELHDQTSPPNFSEPVGSPIDMTDEYDDYIMSISDESDGDLPDWLLAATAYQTADAGVMP